MNLNLSASLNVTRLLFKPNLCLPHHTVSNFNDLPIPLDKAFEKSGRATNIKAVVLDKDDCFAYPDAKEVYEPYKVFLLDTFPTTIQLTHTTATFRETKSSLSWTKTTRCIKYFRSNNMG